MARYKMRISNHFQNLNEQSFYCVRFVNCFCIRSLYLVAYLLLQFGYSKSYSITIINSRIPDKMPEDKMPEDKIPEDKMTDNPYPKL